MPAPSCWTRSSACPPRKARAKNAGLLLAYEESGYDNTKPGRLPDLLPHLSVKRIKDLGADAVKILIYYTPFDDPGRQRHQARLYRTDRRGMRVPTIFRSSWNSSATIQQGGDEKGLEFAKKKPDVVIGRNEGIREAAI